MQHPFRTIIIVLATIVVLTGCSTSQAFKLFLTVKDKEDGKPLFEANVMLDTTGNEDRKFEFDAPTPYLTNEIGVLEKEFSISGYPTYGGKHWYLKVSKEGYEPMVIDIRPNPDRNSSDQPIPLYLTVELQPKAEKPPR